MAVLGLRFCVRAFSSCGKRGPLFIAVRGPLTIAASLVAEHRLQMCRFSSCGSQAQLWLCSMWDLPRPGLEPVSPALAGRFSTTVPPGKPPQPAFNIHFNVFYLANIWSSWYNIMIQFPSSGKSRNTTPLGSTGFLLSLERLSQRWNFIVLFAR